MRTAAAAAVTAAAGGTSEESWEGGERRPPSDQRLTRALALLSAVFGSGVALDTLAVFVIQPDPFPVTVVVTVNGTLAPAASDGAVQRTVRVAPS